MKISCRYCGIVEKPHRCPNRMKRDNSRADKKVYRTTVWIKLREKILGDYNNICLWSLYVDGKIKVATEVHHIKEVLEDKTKAYECDNLIPLNYVNHKKVHALYKNNKLKIQQLLFKMLEDYTSGDKLLGKYKNEIKNISPL